MVGKNNQRLILFLLLFWSCASAPPPKSDELLILISFDGFRWDYMEKTDTPALDKLVADGVKTRSMIPAFPTKTFPNHYTIVTGLYPGNHGVVANNMYDPEFDARFALGDTQAVSDGRWYGGEPIWVTAERQGIKCATLFWPGSEARINGFRPSYWLTYDHNFPNMERVDQILSWLDLPRPQRPNFITLYFSAADDTAHFYGTESIQIEATIRNLDGLVEALLRGLDERDLTGRTNIIIVSDHGMAPASRERVIFLDDYIDLSAIDIVDWSPILAINALNGEVDSVYDLLNNAHPHLTVYRKEDLPERFHYSNHRRIMPIIALADEGWSISSRAYFASHQNRYAGAEHGYDNRYETMRAFFIANGPAFKKGVKVLPFKNIHIYSLLTDILGIEPAANDGTLDSVAVLLLE